MKSNYVKISILVIAIMLGGCEREKNVDYSLENEETTTPHSMETQPEKNQERLNNDMHPNSSAPILNDNAISGVETSSDSTRTPSQ